ncbi:hypothetical protein [Haladaptatus sp. CMAA 1911]|uniref:hypothetical protein n=1 Tax=unclassified Haladaptatus TaxID=2622732 RepID=UPI00375499E9
MSEDSSDSSDLSALEHEESDTNIAKQWTNKSKENTPLPIDDVDVKSEWVGITIYLPEQLREELELVFREHSLESKRSTDLDLKKLRHYYPLVVALGLKLLEDTDTKEIGPLFSYITSEYE